MAKIKIELLKEVFKLSNKGSPSKANSQQGSDQDNIQEDDTQAQSMKS